MNQRNDASFEPRLATLLQHKESLWTPEYRAAYQNTERQARSCWWIWCSKHPAAAAVLTGAVGQSTYRFQ
jgi:hypothetical protein